MNAGGWRQIDKLFQAVLEVEPARRAAYLDKTCAGDAFLRSEVDSLLSADSLEWEFIETPALESAALLLADEQPRFTTGQQVGHYEIVSLIGKGGMGEVYMAKDRILNRTIALKLLPFDYTQDDDRLRRFQREAQTVSALNHPNIITIHELGSTGDQQYIATELIEGETLRDHIVRGPLPLWYALEIVIQTAGALAAAHRAGIVHRDIKPENIMVRPDGYVKVLDFGLAKLAEQSETHAHLTTAEDTVTSSGLLLGTLRYMSPEQASGLSVDARSDIFSLGVVLYEMVTGHRPFDDKSHGGLIKSILTDDPPELGNFLSHAPDRLATVVAKMLSKDRTFRYQTAEELIVDLKLLRDGLSFAADSSKRSGAANPRIPLSDAVPTNAGSPRPRRIFTSMVNRLGLPALSITLMLVLVLASAAGYASYKFLGAGETKVPSTETLAETGTWAIKAPISSPRWQAEPAVLNDVLYVAGGWNVCSPFGDLERYDPETDTWTQRAPMLTARGGHGVGVLEGKLYAVGGSVDCGVHISSVEAYDPASDNWSVKASLPGTRFGHVVAVANGKLYAIGGNTVDGDLLSLNSQYDPDSDRWIEKAPMPTARSAAAVAVVKGIIYVIGGGGYAGTLATVEAYDPVTDSWTSRRSMLMSRINFAASEAGGVIYVFGGLGNRIQVEAYDPAADIWEVVARMPTPGTHFHSATLRGSIYLVGGSDGGNHSARVITFTPEANGVSETALCPTLQTIPSAAIPTQRSNMTVGEINGVIYAAGGYADSGYMDINEAYDPATDRWTTKAALPGKRETRGSNNAVVNGKLYVIGGNARGRCSDLNEAYDPETDKWTTKAPMPTPRCHLAVVALDGLIYALGGTNTNGSVKYNTVEVYNPSIDTWTTAVPMPTARQDLGAASLNGLIYAVGGGNPALNLGGELNIVEAYDPIRNTWSTQAHLPTGRTGMGVGVLNGLLIVVGGLSDQEPTRTIEGFDPGANSWKVLTTTARPRSFTSAVTMNNTLYVFDGNGAPDSRNSVTTNDAISLKPCSNQR